jgi:hypothetical protein
MWNVTKRMANSDVDLLGDVLRTAECPIPKVKKTKLYSMPRFINDHLHLCFPDLRIPPPYVRPKARASDTLTIIPGLPLGPPKKKRKGRTTPTEAASPKKIPVKCHC